MKTQCPIRYALLVVLSAGLSWAGTRSSTDYTIGDSLDAGGTRALSASYTIDGSAGMIGGISSDAASLSVVKAGFIGQLTEVSGLTLTPSPAVLDECTQLQLGGLAMLDDDTSSALPGDDIAWGAAKPPIASISAGGLLTAASVCSASCSRVSGVYQGMSASVDVNVIDCHSDNYGLYSGDGLPDSWQVEYFGEDNPRAAPEVDMFGTGENNRFKYIAGLNPTNPASRFHLWLEPVANGAAVSFSPRFGDRDYAVVWIEALANGTWKSLSDGTVSDDGQTRHVTDTNRPRSRFYRVHISKPE